jgi:hypothetical protein
MGTTFPATYAEHEKTVIEGADRFVACVFKGRGQYDQRQAKTLTAAKKAARKLIANRDPSNIYSKGRPVLVYAVKGIHQVVAATVYP